MFLTIAIPTYNRCSLLMRLLDSIKPVFEETTHSNEITILIRDNASTDNTFEMVKNHSLSPVIKYFKNDENIGALKNILHLIDEFDSQYLFMIGDDDILVPSEFIELIHILKTHQPEFGIINIKDTSGFGYINLEGNNKIKISDNIIDDLSSSYFAGILGYFGCMVISKDAFNKVKKETPELLFKTKTYWPSIELFFNLYKYCKGALISLSPILMIADGACWRMDDWFIFSRIFTYDIINEAYERNIINPSEKLKLINNILFQKKSINLCFLLILFNGKRNLLVKEKLNPVFNREKQAFPKKYFKIYKFYLNFPTWISVIIKPVNMVLFLILYHHIYINGFNLLRKKKKNDTLHDLIFFHGKDFLQNAKV